ncbi:MAG: hypothetical protein ABIJ36_00030 [Patescibacteria group bacterium]|nr:hypothetical protein [Patescibacteria group bacterium]
MLIRTNVYLENTIISELKNIAKENDSTMAKVVRGLLQEALNKNPRNIEGLLALAKKAKSTGIKDLASKHDKYLYTNG